MDPRLGEALRLLIPQATMAAFGGAQGAPAFQSAYAEGLRYHDEQRLRERAMQQREAEALFDMEQERLRTQRADEDQRLTRQIQALKFMEYLPQFSDAALEQAESSGLYDPAMQADYASKALRDQLTAMAGMVPDLGLNVDVLHRAAGDLVPRASERMRTKLKTIYDSLTKSVSPESLELMRKDPTPVGQWGMPFGEIERIVNYGLTPPASPSKLSLEQLYANAVQAGDVAAQQTYLKAMGAEAGSKRKPESGPGTLAPDVGDPEAVGEAYLASLSPSDARLVKSIANYQVDITKAASMRKPTNVASERIRLLKMVQAYDPTYDMNVFGNVSKTRTEFTSGKASSNVRSLNTAIGHIGDLAEKAKALQNWSFTPANVGKNLASKATGKPAVTNFLAAANAVAGELSTLFKGTAGTDQEIKAWRESIDPNASPEQLQGFVETAVQLAFSRLMALRDQYVKGTLKADRTLLSEKARQTLKKIGVDWESVEPRIDNEPGVLNPGPAPVPARRVGRFEILEVR
jgi:hypothetical protein